MASYLATPLLANASSQKDVEIADASSSQQQILRRLNDINNSSGGINYLSSTANLGTSSQSAFLQGALSSNSNIPSADLEFCQRHVLPLLVSTYLALSQPIEAIYYMNYYSN